MYICTHVFRFLYFFDSNSDIQIKGGNGKEGAKGENAPLKKNAALSRKNCRKKDYSCLIPDIDPDNYYRSKDLLGQNVYATQTVTYFGQEGKRGGRGGDAGKAGRGGKAGIGGISLLVDNTGSNVLYNKDSPPRFGDNGKPGEPGPGGLYGDTAISGWFHTLPRDMVDHYSEWRDEYTRHEASKRRSFERGASANHKLNGENQMAPRKQDISFNEKPADYLKFLNEINQNFKNSHLLDYGFSRVVKARLVTA